MAVRLKDIAQDLGVSVITVSKALRGRTDISPTTRDRVLLRAGELNYRPNMLARGLASGRTWTVGMVVPDLVHPFFAEFAKAAARILREHGMALLLASSEEMPEIEKCELRTLAARGVDVLLIASAQSRWSDFFDPGEKPIPFLLVDRNFPMLNASFVGTDDYRAGCLATEHLLSLGRHRLAHIGGRHSSPARDRLRGFRDTLRRRGLADAAERIVLLQRFEEAGDDAGADAMRRLLNSAEPPDSVFCYNDMSALGAIEVIQHAGLRVPEDIAVIGCGNLRYARHLKIPLSTIDQKPELLGRRAAERALEMAENPALPPRSLRIEPALVVRESTVPGGSSGPDSA
jgi:LacI family transcriptional regulator